jgi:hypothetical protein
MEELRIHNTVVTVPVQLNWYSLFADYVSSPGEEPEVGTGRGLEKKEEVTGLLAYLVTDATGRQFLVPSGLLPNGTSPT